MVHQSAAMPLTSCQVSFTSASSRADRACLERAWRSQPANGRLRDAVGAGQLCLRGALRLGGGQVGCNYQFAPNWVIGIEGDGQASDIKGDVTQSVSFTDPRTGGPNTVTGTAHAKTDWIASVTGPLGWTWDRVMLYAKGGAAWAGDKYSADLPAFNEHIATSVTRPGWTVGGGVEWAFWDNWSAKVEYDYYDFSTRNLTLPGTIFGVPEVVPGINVKETILGASQKLDRFSRESPA